MHQFINGSDAAFDDLERRACSACIVFHEEEMPPGSTPTRARVGFEINPANGSALLLVHRPVAYRGTVDSVRNWLSTGEKRFASFDDLKCWVRKDLATYYRLGEGNCTPTNTGENQF